MSNWPRLLLLLCSALTPALCCDWLSEYGHRSNISLQFLRHMGGKLSDQKSPVPFPKKLYKRIKTAKVASQLRFVRDNVELISNLWLGLYHHDNLSSVGWDKTKIKNFLSTLRSQTVELNACVSASQPADTRLTKYYRTLQDHMEGSSTSWELIRRDTKVHLEQLDMLVSHIKRHLEHSPV